MQTATTDLTSEPLSHPNSIATKRESRETIEVLEELLTHSIRLRDMPPKNARWQTADLQFRLLRQLFDGHYKEQIRLVDVLIERIRTLDGAGRVFAGDFLAQDPFLSTAPRSGVGHTAVGRTDRCA